MFGGSQAKMEKKQREAEEEAKRKAAHAEAEAKRKHMLVVRERLERFKREEWERAIDEEESMDDLKDMCKFLLEQLSMTHRAPKLKNIRLKGEEERLPQCEIRMDSDPDKKGTFECKPVLMTEIAEKFDFPDMGDMHPWLEAVDFSGCPWDQEKEPPQKPLILFPSGDLPDQDPNELEEPDPPFFNLVNSTGLYYLLHTNVSCRGKLFAQLRSISKPPPEETEGEDENGGPSDRFADGI
jgi:hypothetical protein